jgi:filamentous hemagglutinin
MPTLKIDQRQFGVKVGRHMLEFGRDPANPEHRKWLMDHITRIHSHPDSVRSGTFSGQGTQLAIGSHSRGPVLFYAKGSDVVITDPSGNFVTILKGGIGSTSFKTATLLPRKP